MKINESMIPLIEKALGFELYEWQKAYLLGETFKEPTGRAVGRTTAYIVKLLLTNDKVINSNKNEDIQKYKDFQSPYYSDFFKRELRMIDDKLTSVGLRTCLLKPKKDVLRNIQIGVEMNTDKLQLKLRAIEKFVGALGDELDRVDNLKECPKCGKLMISSEMYLDNELKSINRECECGYVMGCDFGNELPTHLEGSKY